MNGRTVNPTANLAPRLLTVKQHGGSVPELPIPFMPTSPRLDLQEETQLRVLRRLHATPTVSQRALSREFGISLGSINYCFRALMEKGWVKMHNFSQSQHKLGYAYLLTPAGIAQKSRLTAHFLKRKQAEYEALRGEIEQLQAELPADVTL
jgi:EPS-associated MarR family transcriptional regulator